MRELDDKDIHESSDFSWKKSNVFCWVISACWALEPRERPSFGEILERLQQYAMEATIAVSQDFYTMQETWKNEIAVKVQEIKSKEAVSVKMGFEINVT